MHRRTFLGATGATVGATVAGCLGRFGERGWLAGGSDPVDGRHQWGYDAGSSDYAAGLIGPGEAPTHQHLYSGLRGIPLFDDGVLYTTTAAHDFDGFERWEHTPPVDGGRLRGALYDDSMLCAGRDPRLFWAIDTTDGTEQWRTELAARHRETELGATVATWPVQWITVANDRAFFSTGIGTACVDLEAREERWHTDLLLRLSDAVTPRFWAPAATRGNVITVNQYAENGPPVVFGLDQDDGDINWTAEIEGDAWGAGPPTAGDGRVFVLSPVNDPPDVDGDHQWTQVTAIDPRNGRVDWRTAVDGPSEYHAAVGDGRIYVGHGKLEDTGKVSAIDTSDGSIEWTTPMESSVAFITLADERLYVLDGRYLHALDRDGGEPVWKIDLIEALAGIEPRMDPGVVVCPPVVAEGRLFITYSHGIAGLW